MSKPHKQALYGLFVRKPNGRWERVFPNLAFRRHVAVRAFQSAMLWESCSGNEPRLRKVSA